MLLSPFEKAPCTKQYLGDMGESNQVKRDALKNKMLKNSGDCCEPIALLNLF